MGANIGTTVTNTIVAIVEIGEKEHFRRAFASAAVHDMFNLLSVIVLLPLEMATEYLFRLTKAIVQSLHNQSRHGKLEQEESHVLNKITKPVTNLFIQLDKNSINKIALAKANATVEVKSLIRHCRYTTRHMQNATVRKSGYTESCKFIFHDTGMSDFVIGIILLVLSLIVLCFCLHFITKTLQSLLISRNMALNIRKIVKADFWKPFKFLNGYVAILVGAGTTAWIQSSSIYTSMLTLLVGMRIITLRRVYPLTLGANIGTTTTSILTALATEGGKTQYAMQLALCHLFFNISGLIIWYPAPPMRRAPTHLAKQLGNTVADYRWFAFAYLIFVFFIFPGIIFGLALTGWKIFAGIMVPVGVFVSFVVMVNFLQDTKSEWLPASLQTWDFLPEPCRSLEPYDRVILKLSEKLNIKKISEENNQQSNLKLPHLA